MAERVAGSSTRRVNTVGKWLAVSAACGVVAAGGEAAVVHVVTTPKPKPVNPAIAHHHMLTPVASPSAVSRDLELVGGYLTVQIGMIGMIRGAKRGRKAFKAGRSTDYRETGLR